MNSNKILTSKFINDIQGNFEVPSYQRGYRWGENEVKMLLEDIFRNGNSSYCLQPVVVLKNEDVFELIDGQQRLTTIYLIYKYIQNVDANKPIPAFSIKYKTRDKSEDFLRTLDDSKREDNIDVWFMSNAYATIKAWFEEDKNHRVDSIYNYFRDNVKIIWYEVDKDEKAISLFTRLNIGKIPLTSAELVKAMFLCGDNTGSIDENFEKEFILQWDSIEKDLHDDSLWYFLTDDAKYQTRIDIVLDLIAKKDALERDKYYTFFKFDEMRKKGSMSAIWEEIQHTFLILKDWYEDSEYYHKIGYLIASEYKSIQDIYGLYIVEENETRKSVTKGRFRELLDEAIKESVKVNSENDILALSYENANDRKKLSNILLLFNVESVRKNNENTQRFPFDKYKYRENGKLTGSLEHIHAQHSEGLRTEAEWKEWLKLHVPSVKAVSPDNKELIQEMETAINKSVLDGNSFKKTQEKVVEVLSESSDIGYLHTIDNLALLNTIDNAALNNSTFDVKRNKIVEMCLEGKYIPECTKMVFLKCYTPSEKNQLHFWGKEDRQAYVEVIKKVLGNYLPKSDEEVKEE